MSGLSQMEAAVGQFAVHAAAENAVGVAGDEDGEGEGPSLGGLTAGRFRRRGLGDRLDPDRLVVLGLDDDRFLVGGDVGRDPFGLGGSAGGRFGGAGGGFGGRVGPGDELVQAEGTLHRLSEHGFRARAGDGYSWHR